MPTRSPEPVDGVRLDGLVRSRDQRIDTYGSVGSGVGPGDRLPARLTPRDHVSKGVAQQFGPLAAGTTGRHAPRFDRTFECEQLKNASSRVVA